MENQTISTETKPSPLVILNEFLPPAEVAGVEAQVSGIPDLPEVRSLGDLLRPIHGNDPDELLQDRFLCRGGMGLICGPTGIGKSAFVMQGAIKWAVGKPFFGIEPSVLIQQQGGMRILLAQAENDDGDLAEMRDGVIDGCDDLTPEEKDLAVQRIKLVTSSGKCGDKFAQDLDAVLSANADKGNPFDLVIIDPAFAYLGGDSNNQRDVSHFLRELLHPLVQKYKLGLIIVHHTNKPPRGKEKGDWQAVDLAYLGAGSAEWINAPRAALAIRSIGLHDMYQLVATKRGGRLDWKDGSGNKAYMKYIAHDDRPGVICWHEVESGVVEAKLPSKTVGRPKDFGETECVHAVMAHPNMIKKAYVDAVSKKLACGESTARRMFTKCIKAGWIAENGGLYDVTPEGQLQAPKCPSTVKWES